MNTTAGIERGMEKVKIHKLSKKSQDVLHTSLDVDPQIACQDEFSKTLQKRKTSRRS